MVDIIAKVVKVYKRKVQSFSKSIIENARTLTEILSEFDAKAEPIRIGNPEDGYSTEGVVIVWKNEGLRCIILGTPIAVGFIPHEILESLVVNDTNRALKILPIADRADPLYQKLSTLSEAVINGNLEPYLRKSKEELAKLI